MTGREKRIAVFRSGGRAVVPPVRPAARDDLHDRPRVSETVKT